MARKDPVFAYVSACCNAVAEKPACERDLDDKKSHKFSEATLGSWRCGRCKKPTKVTRHKREQQ
jgi:hypothetical protein